MADHKTRDITKNRLQKLKDQSKKLEECHFQLINIKNASFRRKFGEICAFCMIENDEIVFRLFVDNETETVFLRVLTNDNHFDARCLNLYDNYRRSATKEGKYEIFRLIEDTYTLFLKSIAPPPSTQHPTKYLIFLMRNKQNINQINQYGLLDLMETLITEMCFKLKAQSESIDTTNDADPNTHSGGESQSISCETALIEIADEVFGGGDDRLSLNQIEFVTAMRVRLGMNNKYKNTLQTMFEDIYQMFPDEREDSPPMERCIIFNEFVEFLNTNMSVDKYAWETWNAIKSALSVSPLRERNHKMRDKEDMSVGSTKQKLYDLEKMVNILDELLIFEYALEGDQNGMKMKSIVRENDQTLWKFRVLKHRKVIRLFHDSILSQVLHENERIKRRMSSLIKMQCVAMEKETNDDKNEHLMKIERKYYSLLRKNKQQQDMMKKCEKSMKQKEEEIYRLKCELINVRECPNDGYNEKDTKRNSARKLDKDMLNDRLLRLKGEIAKKKLNVQKQLNLLSVNIDSKNSYGVL